MEHRPGLRIVIDALGCVTRIDLGPKAPSDPGEKEQLASGRSGVPGGKR